MEFENFARRKTRTHRFTFVDSRMEKQIVQKSKFEQINDTRFYFSDRVVSLPILHPCLKTLIKYKDEKGQRTEIYI